jgi:cytochrome c oxidase assembly protein subunit 15
VEFSHRVVASVVGLLTLAVAVLAVRRHKADPWIKLPSLAGAFLVLVAALLGAVVVWTELAWWVRLVHLGIAEGVVACMVVVTLVTWRAGGGAASEGGSSGAWLKVLIAASLAGTVLVILWGSYMVGYGAGSSCGTWPLCRGSLLPEGAAYAIHMVHRFMSAVAGVVLLVSAVMVLRQGARVPWLGLAAWLVLAALAGQVLLGAWTVWAGFTIEMRAVHLAGATLLWAAVVGLATLYGMPRKLHGLEGAAP